MTKLLLTNKNNVNPFPTNVLLLYPLKTSENLQFSNVLRGGIEVEHWLKMGQ